MSFSASVLAVAAMAAALLIVPFGLPGVWVMVAILLVAVVGGAVPWATWVILVVAAGAAEVGEFWLLKTLGGRYGGSRKAFWGAILGGFIGLFVGVPIPLAGSIVAAFLGSFLGAAVVTLLETRSAGHATRVGWGILLARTASVVLKVGVGAVVLAVGAWELLLR
jgi:uncharacterized protein YqgC (DUF456 family)